MNVAHRLRYKEVVAKYDLAERLGQAPNHLCMVLARRRRCGATVAVSIHHITHGAIAAWELRPDLWRPGQEPPVPPDFEQEPSLTPVNRDDAPNNEKRPRTV